MKIFFVLELGRLATFFSKIQNLKKFPSQNMSKFGWHFCPKNEKPRADGSYAMLVYDSNNGSVRSVGLLKTQFFEIVDIKRFALFFQLTGQRLFGAAKHFNNLA